MVWRIGKGQAVRIKEDKWLLVKPSRVLLSPLPSVMAKTKVSSLINHELSVWKFEEVNCVFLPHEAFMILAIPLSRRQPPDCVSWSCTPFGNFRLVALINCWLHQLHQIVLAQVTKLVKVVFGKGYGRCRCPKKSNTLFGGCVTMLFPQNVI